MQAYCPAVRTHSYHCPAHTSLECMVAVISLIPLAMGTGGPVPYCQPCAEGLAETGSYIHAQGLTQSSQHCSTY